MYKFRVFSYIYLYYEIFPTDSSWILPRPLRMVWWIKCEGVIFGWLVIGYIICCLLSSLPSVWIIPSLGTQHRLGTVRRMKKTDERTNTCGKVLFWNVLVNGHWKNIDLGKLNHIRWVCVFTFFILNVWLMASYSLVHLNDKILRNSWRYLL